MAARPVFNTASRRPLAPEEQESAVALGPRPEALLVVIAIAVLLMIGPALVGGLSILDPNLFSSGGGWTQRVPTWLYFPANADMLLTLLLAAMVARAKEDS